MSSRGAAHALKRRELEGGPEPGPAQAEEKEGREDRKKRQIEAPRAGREQAGEAFNAEGHGVPRCPLPRAIGSQKILEPTAAARGPSPVNVSNLALSLLPDAALVERASDDAEAFRALYERHARYVAGVVFRVLGNDGDVDDVVQETFLDAREILRTLEDPRALRGWLVTIAVRRVHRLLRKRRRRAALFFGFVAFAPKHSDPRDGQKVSDLYEALDSLPAELRVPWTLARIEQLTLPEVAAACEVSLATVKRHIAAAETRIQRRLST